MREIMLECDQCDEYRELYAHLVRIMNKRYPGSQRFLLPPILRTHMLGFYIKR